MNLSFSPPKSAPPELRPYQEEALSAWKVHSGRGVIVLATGAGKTLVGAAAIAETGQRTLILVPTIDLLTQWERALKEALGEGSYSTAIGFPTDDAAGQLRLLEWEPADIVLSTYSGATRHLDKLHHFGLLIFDEAHHLPAPVFKEVAQQSSAPYRLGLTATPSRYDGGERDLLNLIGPVVFRRDAAELSEKYLAPHSIKRVLVDLAPDERLLYDNGWLQYISYVRKARLRMPQGFTQLIKRAGRDGAAKKALEGHRLARETALSARNKVEAVKGILEMHLDERALVFCQHVALATRLGERLGLPVVTHETPRPARAAALEAFRTGEAPVLVATSILDEGVDVPDASIGIVVSGTAQARQFVQRLGRIMRPAAGKEALLYEIVTRGTLEERTAMRRRAGSKPAPPR